MNHNIPVPRNQTALMQAIARYVGSGHYFWTTDEIPQNAISGFFQKWSAFALHADAPARAYRRKTGRASVHLLLHPDFASEATVISWWMLSSKGKDGLTDNKVPGRVFDARRNDQRIRVNEYELTELTKIVRSAGKTKRITSWTWRLTAARYKAWEAYLIQLAKSEIRANLLLAIEALLSMPMFGGIREQVKSLINECNRMLRKLKRQELGKINLPVMTFLKLWKK